MALEFDDLVAAYQPRVVIQFRDDMDIDFESLFDKEYTRLNLPTENETIGPLLPWDRLSELNTDTFRFRTLHRGVTAQQIEELQAEARANAYAQGASYDVPDMRGLFELRYATVEEAEIAITEIVDQNGRLPRHILDIYVDGLPELPPRYQAPLGVQRWGDDPEASQQTHLNAFPAGIGARYAIERGWNGGRVRFADIEQGWLFGAADLPIARDDAPEWGVSVADPPILVAHGTAVLALVNALDNTQGGIGVAPVARPYLLSQWTDAGGGVLDYSIVPAIMYAIRRDGNGERPCLRPGDVLLIEAQTRLTPGGPLLPVEVHSAVRSAIRLATWLGITVVEAAGNGNANLDTIQDAQGRAFLNRNGKFFRESGAILVGSANNANVGAAVAAAQWEHWHSPSKALGGGGRLTNDELGAGDDRGTNFGSRIDCFASGTVHTLIVDENNLDPANPNHGFKTINTGGTSTAAAIIAGAAVLVQEMARRFGDDRCYPPSRVRAWLSDVADGRGARTVRHDRFPLGAMPNLWRLLQGLQSVDPGQWNQPEPPKRAVPRLVVPQLRRRDDAAGPAHGERARDKRAVAAPAPARVRPPIDAIAPADAEPAIEGIMQARAEPAVVAPAADMPEPIDDRKGGVIGRFLPRRNGK
jgi:hypothetical protein